MVPMDTNRWECVHMDTNGMHVPMAEAPQYDSETSRDRFFFSEWIWCGVESFVTLALEDLWRSWKHLILSMTLTQILRALKEVETSLDKLEQVETGWAIAFAHCLSEESPGGGQLMAAIQFGHRLQLTRCIHLCTVWATTCYTLIGHMWEEQRLKEALMLVYAFCST